MNWGVWGPSQGSNRCSYAERDGGLLEVVSTEAVMVDGDSALKSMGLLVSMPGLGVVTSGQNLMVTGCGFSEAHQFWWSDGAAA